MELKQLITKTTWNTASDTINSNNAKINEAVIRLENATYKNKGYYKTVEQLRASFPTPSVGSMAYVGKTYPFAIYLWNNDTNAWEDSGMTGSDTVVCYKDISVSTWIEDSSMEGYSYRCDLDCPGVTETDYAEVLFGKKESMSGNYSSICETKQNAVSIWSSVNTDITVPAVIVYRGYVAAT